MHDICLLALQVGTVKFPELQVVAVSCMWCTLTSYKSRGHLSPTQKFNLLQSMEWFNM
jgi:hypothetical protein